MNMIEKFFIDLLLFVLKPIIGSVKELRETIKSTKKNLHLYARQISNPGIMHLAEIDKAEVALRENAADFSVFNDEVKCQRFLNFLGVVPSNQDVIVVSQKLIGLSNGLNRISTYYAYSPQPSGLSNAKESERILSLLNTRQNFCDQFSGWIVFGLVMAGTVTVVEYLVKTTKYILGVF